MTTIDETAMAETSKDMEEGEAPPISLAVASPEVKPLAGAVSPAPATSKDGDALGDSTEDAGVAAEVSAAAANPTKAINRSARIHIFVAVCMMFLICRSVADISCVAP
ncbi:hypothetical protein Tco_1006794 [Tanacetum coccineum]|uniref:Uncharacterized protein n=1 Tax=Tanacetum coccineum TaxID=301880 RepID=A0ABQ5FIQ9_9ASTR